MPPRVDNNQRQPQAHRKPLVQNVLNSSCHKETKSTASRPNLSLMSASAKVETQGNEAKYTHCDDTTKS
eukprot:6486494-Amphidinium_carterae.3